MGQAATRTQHNRTITIDFHDETTYAHLRGDGKAFVELVMAFILSIGFQLKHQATCTGGGCLTRHSHYLRIRLGGGVSSVPHVARCSRSCRILSCAIAHIPSDVVVDRWDSYGRVSQVLDFPSARYA